MIREIEIFVLLDEREAALPNRSPKAVGKSSQSSLTCFKIVGRENWGNRSPRVEGKAVGFPFPFLCCGEMGLGLY
jgi:hypothetical protein